MNCATCGSTIPPGATVCPSCGMPAPYNPPTPNFGAPNIPSANPPTPNFGAPNTPSYVPPPPNQGTPASGQYPPYQGNDAFQGTPPPTYPYPGAQQGISSPQNQPAGYIPPGMGQQSWMPGGPLAPGTQPTYPPAYQPSGPQPTLPPPARRGLSGTMITLIIVAVLLVLGGSGLIYYTAVYHPNQLHAQATSTAVAQLNATALAQAHATGTAQAYVQATAQAQASATAQAIATATALNNILTTATTGTPALNDHLTANDANGWFEQSDANGTCKFTGGAFHASNNALCFARSTNFSNFAFQAKETNVKNGGDSGLIFRLNIGSGTGYFFSISSSGTYLLFVLKGNNKNAILSEGGSASINSGSGASNLISVVVRGSTISMFVNKQYITQMNDSTINAGSIGVFADVGNGSSEEAAFNDAQVWTL